MKVKLVLVFVLAIFGLFVWRFWYQNLRGARPAFGPPVTDITKELPTTPVPSQNSTAFPLKLPDGFSTSIFAKDLGAPRVLAWDPNGVLLASIPPQGRVVALPDGKAIDVATGLNKPHGLAFHDGKLYIAEMNEVAIYDYDTKTLKASHKRKIIDLPTGGNHVTRTIGFGPDGKLYVSIGSSCNACIEKDARRAAIWIANADGSDFHAYATGLRNAVFFTWRGSEMWATVMGRDFLGDNTPPETIVTVKEGKNYGWPYCYGKQIPDKTFEGTEERCKTTEPPVVEYQAHSAPLGLAFDKNYLYVAMHGSWNRTVPTGYKIVRFDVNKNYEASDFITGWLTSRGALGRPVDLLFDDKGNLFISDDKAGVVYKVTQK